MSLSSNERARTRQACGACGLVRPKGARWKWCHSCDRGPRPFCPSCWPGHSHELRVRVRALEITAQGGPELLEAVGRFLRGQLEPIAPLERGVLVSTGTGPLEPDLILPRGFDRLGETKKG
jgi:hypothetical protein